MLRFINSERHSGAGFYGRQGDDHGNCNPSGSGKMLQSRFLVLYILIRSMEPGTMHVMRGIAMNRRLRR